MPKIITKDVVDKLAQIVRSGKDRSQWGRGVRLYAVEILESVLESVDYYGPAPACELEKYALNGAKDWKQYSEGGSSLCYTGQIVDRLCNPTEKARFWKNPDRWNELEWQARALWQAFHLVILPALEKLQ